MTSSGWCGHPYFVLPLDQPCQACYAKRVEELERRLALYEVPPGTKCDLCSQGKTHTRDPRAGMVCLSPHAAVGPGPRIFIEPHN